MAFMLSDCCRAALMMLLHPTIMNNPSFLNVDSGIILESSNALSRLLRMKIKMYFFFQMFQFFLFQFVPSDLQHQHVSKEEEEDLTDQQVCKQDKNSSLDLDDSEPPQIKEEKEEPCTSQEREQLGLKQESDNLW